MASQLDFFAVPVPDVPPRQARPEVVTNDRVADDEALARHLETTGHYRILRKLQPRPIVDHPRPGFPRRGIILDAETTGLNYRTDEIIEIGVIAFTFNDEGELGDVTGVYGGLQQPTIAIPADITRLTGIADDMVAGQVIDTALLNALIEPADLIIAHNATFDCPFCEAFSPLSIGSEYSPPCRRSALVLPGAGRGCRG